MYIKKYVVFIIMWDNRKKEKYNKYLKGFIKNKKVDNHFKIKYEK